MTVLPAREPLEAVAERLRAAGIPYALGGSSMLHAIGLESRVGDWDLTTDVAVDEVTRALADLKPVRHGNSGVHADHKLVCFGATVEVICRMAFFAPTGIVHIPTIATGNWQGHPIGSPAAWAVAYALMAGEKPGYEAKAERLFAWSAGRISDAERAALAREPIPPAIASRLAAAQVAREAPPA